MIISRGRKYSVGASICPTCILILYAIETSAWSSEIVVALT